MVRGYGLAIERTGSLSKMIFSCSTYSGSHSHFLIFSTPESPVLTHSPQSPSYLPTIRHQYLRSTFLPSLFIPPPLSSLPPWCYLAVLPLEELLNRSYPQSPANLRPPHSPSPMSSTSSSHILSLFLRHFPTLILPRPLPIPT